MANDPVRFIAVADRATGILDVEQAPVQQQ
jgi:hypothetical protein